jgi:hypothetical protein
MKFRATIEAAGKTATGIPIPDKVIESLGAGKRVAVVATLKGYSYRSTVSPSGGRFMLPLSAEHRNAAGVKAGDTLDVILVLDEAPRTVEVPKDFAAAMKAAPGARKAFDALAYSHRKEHVRAIEEAKQPETRARRIAKAVDKLTGA